MTQTTANIASILERISDAVIALDNNGCCTYMNSKAGEFFEVNPEKIIGKYIWTKITEGAGQLFRQAYEKAMAEQKYVYLEEFYPPQDKWFENHIYPSPEGLSIYFRDITERKKQELQLKQKEERYQNLVEQALDGIIQINENGKIILVNPAICRMLGYTPEEFLQLNIEDTYQASEKHLFTKKISQIKENGSMRLESMMLKKDGTMIPVESVMSRTGDGNFQAIVRDISERKKAEDAIKASEEQYRDLVDNITDLICTHDLDGRILSMNSAAEKTIGLRFDPQRNFNLKTILTIGTKNKYDGYIAEILQNGHAQGLMKIKNNSGEVRIWEFNNSLKKTGNNTPPVIRGYARDVTEQKNAEEILKEKGNFIESIINFSPEIIYLYDIEEKNNVFINEGMQTNLGYSNAEIKAMGNQVLPLLMHPDDYQFYLHHTFPRYMVARDKEIIQHEFRMHDKKGNWHSLYCKESIFQRKPDGTPKQIFGTTIDITEQKETHEKLVRSETAITSILENTDDFIFAMDKELNLLYYNTNFSRAVQSVTGKIISYQANFKSFVRPETQVAVLDYFTRVLKGEQLSLEHKTNIAGKYLFVEAFLNPIKNLQGEITGVSCFLKDITRRKKVEEEIIKNEEKYRDLIENISDLICTHDLNGKILSVNRAAEQLMGYKFDPLANLNIRDILADKENEFDQYINDIRKTGSAHGIMKVRTGKNELRIWEYNNSLKIAEGKSSVVRGYARDITEYKKAEEAIKEREEKFRSFFDQSADSIYIFDETGRFQDVNVVSTQLLGYTLEEFRNLSIHDIVFKEDMPANPIRLDLLQTGESVIRQRKFKRKDGMAIEVEVHSKKLPDGKFLGVVRDITDRKNAEEKIKKSELLNRLLFEHIREAMAYHQVLYENGKPVDFVYLEVNDAFFTHTGLRNVVGKKVSEVVPGILKTNPELIERFGRVALTGKSEQYETYIADWKTWFFTSLYSVSKDIVVSVFDNITERKKADKEIKNANKQLRQLASHLQTIREEERKRIAREIHDELGQQLTAIKMDVAWIDKKTPRDTEDIKKKLKNIITLLDGSNLSIRKILSELRPGILDNYDLLEALEWQGKQFTNSTGIPVIISSAESGIRLTENITTCIFRVYQEALTNIMRYAKAKQVFVSLKIMEDNVIVSICDDGKGFETSSLKNKESFGILGMKERVLSLQGKFELVSAKGKGTSITISLPCEVLTNTQINL